MNPDRTLKSNHGNLIIKHITDYPEAEQKKMMEAVDPGRVKPSGHEHFIKRGKKK